MYVSDDSRDYDMKDYRKDEDRRFIIAKKDAVFAQFLCFAAILAEFITAYLLCPKDPAQMTYILGFPTWFFAASCLSIAAFVIAMIYCGKISKDVSLAARDSGEYAQ